MDKEKVSFLREAFDQLPHHYQDIVVEVARALNGLNCFEIGVGIKKVLALPDLKKGYITFTVTGTGFTSTEWQKRFDSTGYPMSDYARQILFRPDYDKNHRLENGKIYKVVLMPSSLIKTTSGRKYANLKALGVEKFGSEAVEGLKAELALLICEKFSATDLKRMGLLYIAVLHKPIIDEKGSSRIFCSISNKKRKGLRAYLGQPTSLFGEQGAIAYLVE